VRIRRNGRQTVRSYETKEAAEARLRQLRREAARLSGLLAKEAIDRYREYLSAKGNRPRSIETTVYRLTVFFGPVLEEPITALTAADGVRLYDRLLGEKTRFRRAAATDTRLNITAEARTFVRWCRAKNLLRLDLLEKVEATGRRRQGKAQLTESEAARFLSAALELAMKGDAGATAAATALLTGMRASEIAERVVRDLDRGGAILQIPKAKTRTGVRKVKVAEVLRPFLLRLAAGKNPGDRLFANDADRDWVLRSVRRVCRAAKVPLVSTHGLRGTHASIAADAGESGLAVAQSLGHSSFTTTTRHYATPDAVAGGRQRRVEEALALSGAPSLVPESLVPSGQSAGTSASNPPPTIT
jgi:integrase